MREAEDVKAMDIKIESGPNKGKTLKTIFKFDANKLIICYAIDGDKRPDAFESTAENTFLLIEYRKK